MPKNKRKGESHIKYIIQPDVRLENTENKIINVLTPGQINDYLKKGFHYRERINILISGHTQYELICAEIWKEADEEHSMIIPAFHIPHRRYTTYVYAYAINQYCSGKGKTQRQVAEETRIKFDLKTFAHTTVGRAVKALAKIIANTDVADNEAIIDEQAEDQKEEAAKTNKTDEDDAKKFPTLHDTKLQREIIKGHFRNRLKTPDKKDFKTACECIVAHWRKNHRRLLLYICTRLRV